LEIVRWIIPSVSASSNCVQQEFFPKVFYLQIFSIVAGLLHPQNPNFHFYFWNHFVL